MVSQKNVHEIQITLDEAGYTPGDIDGVWGRNTIAAVRAFQKGKGLVVDGILGPATLTALFVKNRDRILAAGETPPWLSEARRLINTKEFLGPRNNPAILDWADNLDVAYPGDEVPWCGLFVGHCISATLPQETLPTGILSAQGWLKCGMHTTPRLGAIMVFWRDGRHSGKGHVGFYAGQDHDAYRILGGNQSNSVCYAWVSKERFLDARWPRSADSLLPLASTIEISRAEDLSTQEA
jgi:uncharacterized protein (TIGR02594 family)